MVQPSPSTSCPARQLQLKPDKARFCLLAPGGADAFAKQYPFLRVAPGGGADADGGDAFLVYPSQILPSPSGLFLGSQITTTNRQVLQDLKITYLLSLSLLLSRSASCDTRWSRSLLANTLLLSLTHTQTHRQRDQRSAQRVRVRRGAWGGLSQVRLGFGGRGFHTVWRNITKQ